jgi:siroheme synthase (precorrin-2 oxidase/ferrochelatase)
MKYGGNPSLAEFLYPNLSCKIGSNTVYEISLLSNIVGMQLPGLHSLFLSVKVELIRHHNKVISPYFKLDHIDHRFGIINLDYFGNNIACKLKTLERPHYKIKKCSDIEGKIPESLSLNGKKILIIGGSRGIGATLAKVTAMIGAKITITYNTGIEDARKLRNDIESFTGQKTEVLRLDISDIIQIKTFKFDYDFLFFFASPKIIETKAEFDFNLFDNFYKIYCKSFYIIAMNFNKSGGRLIYWPSTIFLSQDIKNFKEYVLAKSIGEKICKSLKSETQMKVIFERLEKTETDQTLSLIKESMQDSVDVAINIMKLVCDKK